jgi:hypothetical protein
MANNFSHENPEKVKEIIFYFSSRLRAASSATLNAKNDSKGWMLTNLVYELVTQFLIKFFVLEYSYSIVIAMGFVIRWDGRGLGFLM